MNNPIRITITDADFRKLVRGEVATTYGFQLENGEKKEPVVEMVLQDIGYDAMAAHIDEAILTSPLRQ